MQLRPDCLRSTVAPAEGLWRKMTIDDTRRDEIPSIMLNVGWTLSASNVCSVKNVI